LGGVQSGDPAEARRRATSGGSDLAGGIYFRPANAASFRSGICQRRHVLHPDVLSADPPSIHRSSRFPRSRERQLLQVSSNEQGSGACSHVRGEPVAMSAAGGERHSDCMKRSTAVQSGLSLVEMTIVLVTIGLLLGAFLFGQELLVAGRSKAVIVQLNELSAAVSAYQDRYRAIPGDDPQAQLRWNLTGVPAAVPSSPGDGRVDGSYNQPPAVPEAESRLFWWHLRQAGFIAGATDPTAPALAAQQPANAVGGLVGVTMGAGPTTVGLTQLIVCTANLPGKIAIEVDTRLDDGKSAEGPVRAQRQTAPNENIGAAAANYLDDGGSYLVCKRL
jgi:hypothetical protein